MKKGMTRIIGMALSLALAGSMVPAAAFAATSDSAAKAKEESFATQALPAPTITATSVKADGYKTLVTLSWTAVPGAQSYKIDSRTPSTEWSLQETGLKTTTATISLYKNDLKYMFRVYAMDANYAKGGYAETASWIKTSPSYPDYSKVEVKLASATSAKITWPKVAGADGYQILKSTSSGDATFKHAGYASASAKTYTVKGLAAGKKYYFKVAPYSLNGTTKVANTGMIGKYVTTAPAKTTITSAKISGSSSSKTYVDVAWKKKTNADGYYVYRSTSKTKNFKMLQKTSLNKYTDYNAAFGKTYYYKVIPYVSNYNGVTGKSVITKGAASAVKAVKTIPATLKITSAKKLNNSGKYLLKWKKAANASGYYVTRSKYSSGDEKILKKITKASTTSYTYTGGYPSKYSSYYIRVFPYIKVGSKIFWGNSGNSFKLYWSY